MITTTNDIRSSFLDFFETKKHKTLPSGALVPTADPTLMFANAGMVQFKNIFTGEKPFIISQTTNSKNEIINRAATVQKCIRISGKHNDLENVGRTSRHHTFFEMLGNFSFGDYFKEDACKFGWEFLTDVLGLDENKLWVSVFKGDNRAPADDEAALIWTKKIGVRKDRILRGSTKDNFWAMGDTGPCGPCSEIMFDRGEAFGEACLENGERFFELWNLVFMQYMVTKPGGDLMPLLKPSIDTGAGLERIASVLQNVNSNYDIDEFAPLIATSAQLAEKKYGYNNDDDVSIRIIADHARMTAHLIAEGVFPEKTGREYVLRRVMRRAIRHGHKLGIEDLFFYKVVNKVVDVMGYAYDELVEHRELIKKVCIQEEQSFRRTLSRGLDLLRCNTNWAKDNNNAKILPGKIAFDLSATYGFPLDLIKVIGKEDDFIVDEKDFIKAQKDHKAASGVGKIGETAVSPIYNKLLSTIENTKFVGYDQHQVETEILAIINTNKEIVQTGETDHRVNVVLKETSFYAESGGQVGDTGILYSNGVEVQIKDTTSPVSGLVVHHGVVVKGLLSVGAKITAKVDVKNQRAIALHHTATHLLHCELRNMLGSHASQKGSRVTSEGLRFDFTHFEPLTREQLLQLERGVSNQIRNNHTVVTIQTDYETAKTQKVMAIFDEKYGDIVRLVTIGDDSKELCGGIHAKMSGNLGAFFIISEAGIASGVRRIEAVVGNAAVEWQNQQRIQIENAANLLKSRPSQLVAKIEKLLIREKELNKEIETLKKDLAGGNSSDLLDNVKAVCGIKVLGAILPIGDPSTMRIGADQLKQKIGSGVICLGGNNKGKAAIIVAITKDLTKKLNANQLIKEVSAIVGGKGGGKPDMAQAGGANVSKLNEAVNSIYDAVAKVLK